MNERKINILIYYPSNKPTIAFSTLLPELNKKYKILFLTHLPKEQLHEDLEKFNIETFIVPATKLRGILFYLYHVKFLIQFSRQKNIAVIFSHLMPNNIIAVIAQFFIKSKVVAFRHHFDTAIDNTRKIKWDNEYLGNFIINVLAKKIIVPCSNVYNGMIKHEFVSTKKLSIIPYYYNFDLYPTPNEIEVKKLKDLFKCKLLLLFSSRMVPLKRHLVGLKILKNLIHDGLDVKLLILDNGPEFDNIKQFIYDHNLDKNAFLIGYTSQIINYIKACDILIHPSLTEASNSTVKELGIHKKVVLVCNGVGDFDDYIIHNENGFIVPPANAEYEFTQIIKHLYNNPDQMLRIGANLHNVVIEKFSFTDKAIKLYDELVKQ